MYKSVAAALLITGVAIAACGSDPNGTAGTGGAGGEASTTSTGATGGAATTSSSNGGPGGSGGGTVTCKGTDGTTLQPGESEACDETEGGDPVTYGPGGTPTGVCQRGKRACGATGKLGKCEGAVGASTRDCTSQDDHDCNGLPDAGECPGCDRGDGTLAMLNEASACFTFPAPALPDTGVCVGGMKSCKATPDKTALAWSDCAGEAGPTSATDSCDAGGDGDENCDGTTHGGCDCVNGDSEACGSCGGMQTCASGHYGACSVATPPNFGTNCGSCGGSIDCSGACSIATPGNYGTSCNSGCGTIQCSGACSSNVGNVNQACGSCGGHVLCNGSCSVGTPSNYGSVTSYLTRNDSFACCFINETRFYGGACDAGYRMAGCTVTKTGGGGTVYVQSAGGNETTDCSCAVHINNNGLEGASYIVTINEVRRCN